MARPPSPTRRRIAAYGVLVIVVALAVGLFQVAADLRANKRANATQLAHLRDLGDTNAQLRDLVTQQADVLEGLADDEVEPALRDTAAELAALSARILDRRSTITTHDTAADSSSPSTRVVTVPGAQRPVVVQTPPGPPGPRGPSGPPGPPGASATPRPTAAPAPCPAEVLRICLTPRP